MSVEILEVEPGGQLKHTSHSLPEPSPNEIIQFYKDDRDILADSVTDCLPPPDVIMKASPANYTSICSIFVLG